MGREIRMVPPNWPHPADAKQPDPTWVQVWETVSEGTPVTPPFATREELIDYLVANGDFWDQKRGHGGYSRAQAEAFVSAGYAPSMVMMGGVTACGIAIPHMLATSGIKT